MVPSVRLELTCSYKRQILSLMRLPIPPQGHKNDDCMVTSSKNVTQKQKYKVLSYKFLIKILNILDILNFIEV